MIVRVAGVADTVGIQLVSHAAGQSGTGSGVDAEYVRLLLETARVRVAADESDGIVSGWGAVRSGPLGSLLTDLFIHPKEHGQGIGRDLLRGLWPDRDAPGRFTFSSQHANALPVYTRAGLLPDWPLLYLNGPRTRLPATGLDVVPVDPEDAVAGETELTGGDRSADYAYWTRGATSRSFVVRDGARTVAAGVGDGGELLHLTCADPAVAAEALFGVLRALGGDRVSACVPGRHPAVVTLLRSRFRVTDYDHAMSTPDLALPATWAYSPGLA